MLPSDLGHDIKCTSRSLSDYVLVTDRSMIEPCASCSLQVLPGWRSSSGYRLRGRQSCRVNDRNDLHCSIMKLDVQDSGSDMLVFGSSSER